MAGCLSHIRVIDLSRVFAGPWCTQLFADLGAEVIKIEHPEGGDDVRKMGSMLKDAEGRETGETSSFLAMNRGKRSVALDISKPAGQQVVRRLAESADVFIENFKTGTMLRYGLDYDRLRENNTGLVYCSITGYGQTGPSSSLPGYDAIFQAMSGVMSVTGSAEVPSGSEPSLVGYSVSDINAGLYAAVAILAALNYRDNVSGEGQSIDIALLDAQIAAMSHMAMNFLVSGKLPIRAGAASQINCPWQAFVCEDQPLMVTVGNNRQFERLMEALGRPEIGLDPRFASNRSRMEHRSALLEILYPLFRGAPARTWMDRLNAVGVPSGPINDLRQAFDEPQVKHRGMLAEISHPKVGALPIIANPIRFSQTPPAYSRPPPELGAHTREVLATILSMRPEEYEQLQRDGVVGADT
jgi:crotonobetainyl-CoA:carnitine CoA-transferase CaiB-like acyl-CoA transferase